MISFRDMTFCRFYNKCKEQPCPHGIELTPQAKKHAEKWWGSPDAPISVFSAKPECFKENGEKK